MTTEQKEQLASELQKHGPITHIPCYWLEELIDSWAAEIIGKKRKTGYKYDNNDLRQATNRLIETQRRRAGLPEEQP